MHACASEPQGEEEKGGASHRIPSTSPPLASLACEVCVFYFFPASSLVALDLKGCARVNGTMVRKTLSAGEAPRQGSRPRRGTTATSRRRRFRGGGVIAVHRTSRRDSSLARTTRESRILTRLVVSSSSRRPLRPASDPGSSIHTHNTFSLNLGFGRGKYVLFIGCERVKTDALKGLIVV